MKTTIELPDVLAMRARQAAAEYGCTLKSLVEEGLRRELDRRASAPAWHPRMDLAFGDGGLTPEAEHLSWRELRELSDRPISR